MIYKLFIIYKDKEKTKQLPQPGEQASCRESGFNTDFVHVIKQVVMEKWLVNTNNPFDFAFLVQMPALSLAVR